MWEVDLFPPLEMLKQNNYERLGCMLSIENAFTRTEVFETHGKDNYDDGQFVTNDLLPFACLHRVLGRKHFTSLKPHVNFSKFKTNLHSKRSRFLRFTRSGYNFFFL